MARTNKGNKSGVRITRDLIIAALALRCPWRTEMNPIWAGCSYGDYLSNCNPRLCTRCTDIFRDMAKIAEDGIDNYI